MSIRCVLKHICLSCQLDFVEESLIGQFIIYIHCDSVINFFFTCCIGNGSWIPEPHSRFSAVHQYEDSTKNVWLFNITADPNERTDLSSKYPSIVKEMLDVLQVFNNSAVPCRYPKEDPRGDPALLGGYWGPWL